MVSTRNTNRGAKLSSPLSVHRPPKVSKVSKVSKASEAKKVVREPPPEPPREVPHYEGRSGVMRALLGSAPLEFRAEEREYNDHAGYKEMKDDGMLHVMHAWHEVEGGPNREHRAARHSYNSINKYAGCVTLRTVDVFTCDGTRVARMHALFGDEEEAWVFEETEVDGRKTLVHMARIDDDNMSFNRDYGVVGTAEFAEARPELCMAMETALWGCA